MKDSHDIMTDSFSHYLRDVSCTPCSTSNRNRASSSSNNQLVPSNVDKWDHMISDISSDIEMQGCSMDQDLA